MITRGDEFICREFANVEFGDKRLNKRLVEIGIDFVDSPQKSIPQICGTWSKTKAAYRFFDNSTVSREEILRSHRDRTNRRLESLDEVLFVADTTFFTFPNHPNKEGLGEVGDTQTDIDGVLAHSTVAVAPKSGRMKGIYDQQVLIRNRDQEDKTIFYNGEGENEVVENENKKWKKSIQAVINEVPAGVKPTIVFDRGGDSWDLVDRLKGEKVGYVVRASQNRAMRDEQGERGRVREWVKGIRKIGEIEREIYNEDKERREEVEFVIQAGTCEVLAPHPKRQGMQDEGARQVNVVRAKQKGEGEEGVEWILYTDRSIEGLKEAREVIEVYENRWVIEDWHECLKERGAEFENRQMERWERMDRLLGVISVVGWRLLALRDLARDEGDQRPEECLSEAERKVIEHMDEEVAEGDTAEEYLKGVARIGGYMDRSNDPPPGWQILWRGFSEVQKMAIGYRMAQ